MVFPPDDIDGFDTKMLCHLNDLAAQHRTSRALEEPLTFRNVEGIQEPPSCHGVYPELRCRFITEALWWFKLQPAHPCLHCKVLEQHFRHMFIC